MTTTTTPGRRPHYFLVVCRKDESLPRLEDGVWGGRRAKGYVGGSGVQTGDVLLLLQDLECQGVGIVTRVETGGEEEFTHYQYFPLCHPIVWDSLPGLRETIPELRRPLNFKGNWIQDIGNTSFRAATADRLTGLSIPTPG